MLHCHTSNEEGKIDPLRHSRLPPPPTPGQCWFALYYQTCPSGLFQGDKDEAGIKLRVFEDLHFFKTTCLLLWRNAKRTHTKRLTCFFKAQHDEKLREKLKRGQHLTSQKEQLTTTALGVMA